MSSRTAPKAGQKPARRGKKPTKGQRLFNRIGLVLVVGFIAFALIVIFTTPPPADNGQRLPERVGEPWEYDERFNAYWDPRPGHEHWHQGRPPAPDER